MSILPCSGISFIRFDCELLPKEECAFAIGQRGFRCLLETSIGLDGLIIHHCQVQEVMWNIYFCLCHVSFLDHIRCKVRGIQPTNLLGLLLLYSTLSSKREKDGILTLNDGARPADFGHRVDNWCRRSKTRAEIHPVRWAYRVRRMSRSMRSRQIDRGDLNRWPADWCFQRENLFRRLQTQLPSSYQPVQYYLCGGRYSWHLCDLGLPSAVESVGLNLFGMEYTSWMNHRAFDWTLHHQKLPHTVDVFYSCWLTPSFCDRMSSYCCGSMQVKSWARSVRSCISGSTAKDYAPES